VTPPIAAGVSDDRAAAGAANGRPAAAPRSAREIALAEFVLVRVAMLPYDDVLALVPDAFRLDLRRAAAMRSLAEEAAQDLSDALHGVVPLCPDQKTRRAVLNVRRALYGGTLADPDAAQRVLASVPMPAETTALADRWHERRTRADHAQNELAASWDDVQRAGRTALRDLLARDTISNAVSVASPELIDMLARGERGDRGKLLKATLSLARYVTRAATKTSPFSSLTGVLPSAFGDGGEPAYDITAATWQNSVRINRALCAAVDFATSDLLAERPAARVACNASLRVLGDGRLEWHEPHYFAVLGRPWRGSRPAAVRMHPSIAHVLGSLRGATTVGALRDEIAALGLDADKVQRFVAMLLRRGALRNADAPDPFANDADASLLERDADDPFSRFSARFAQLRAHVATLRDADYIARERVLGEVRREADALTQAAGIEAERLALKNVVLETCVGTSAVPAVSGGVRDICEDVARTIQRRMVPNPVYVALREHFLQTYGERGAADLETFVSGAYRAFQDPATFERCKTAAHVPPPVVLAPFTVFGQLGGPADGARFVVNSIVSGTGLLTARYAGEDGDGSRALQAHMKRWLARCANGAAATEVSLAGDCNDLQAHPRLTERVLPWTGDFVRPEHAGVDRIGDLLVTYDRERFALRVTGLDGRERALSYLGAVYLNAAYGAEYLLMVLGQPYVASLPEEWTVDERWDDVTPFERVDDGGIVFRRATWLVRGEYLRSWFARGDVHDLVHIRRECERYAIPPRFFAKAVVAGARRRLDAPLDAKKPQWIDTENPLCLALLRRLLDVSPWIEIAEMLPEGDSMPAGASGARHACEIQFEITV
jgi:hypothetical protein